MVSFFKRLKGKAFRLFIKRANQCRINNLISNKNEYINFYCNSESFLEQMKLLDDQFLNNLNIHNDLEINLNC